MSGGKWAKVGSALANIGLRGIGGALGGPAGAALGGMVAEKLGVATADEALESITSDPATALERLREMNRMEELRLGFVAAQNAGQVAINTADASSGNAFQSGWRPFIGWVCGAGLAYEFLFRTAAAWMVQVAIWSEGADMSSFPTPPGLGLESLMPLLFGMLGLAGMRTFEKTRG